MTRNSSAECGVELYRRREIREALHFFLKAIREGEDPREHLNERWNCWMLLGEFERAWQESDRLQSSESDPIVAKHLLIQCKRGLGDAIQFLRYGSTLPKRQKITIQAPERLLPLLHLLPFVAESVSLESGIHVECDCCIESSDLPYWSRSTIAELPPPLTIPTSISDIAKGRGSFRIGFKWTAGAWNPVREMPLQALTPLIRSLWQIPRTQWISLEKEDEGSLLGCGQLPGPCTGNTILETVRQIASMDLVITVDTMIAHLAGSLRRPVWIVLPFESDWRWMLHREDSPWYPSARLFRQAQRGGWASQLRTVQRELMHVLHLRGLA